MAGCVVTVIREHERNHERYVSIRTPAISSGNSTSTENAGTCDVQAKKPTQAVVGARNADGTYFVYSADMSSQSGGPLRLNYDPTAESDLAVYRPQYGLPACTSADGCFRKTDQRGGSYRACHGSMALPCRWHRQEADRRPAAALAHTGSGKSVRSDGSAALGSREGGRADQPDSV